MGTTRQLETSEPLACLAGVGGRSWVLLGLGQLPGGDCLIADTEDAGAIRVRGFFEGATGDVFPCSGADEEPERGEGPAVHVIGALDGSNGQLTVRQEQGNYLRICRWDRIDAATGGLQGAMLRTLPQCGCGGSLGTPKLFSSFAQMSAYHFAAFFAGA